MTKSDLLKAANELLRDGRHTATVSIEDRVEAGQELARSILNFFNSKETNCPQNCRDCFETAKANGDEILYDDSPLS